VTALTALRVLTNGSTKAAMIGLIYLTAASVLIYLVTITSLRTLTNGSTKAAMVYLIYETADLMNLTAV
jgi:hypothetical protein